MLRWLSAREQALVRFALGTRLGLLFVALASRLLVEPYDSSADILLGEGGIVNYAAQSFARWDALYFLQICDTGYGYEQEMAFFPLLPAAIRLLSAIFSSLFRRACPWVDWRLVAGVAIVNTSSLAATLLLYRLGIAVTKDERLAYRSAALFAASPASIFLSAIYTESSFAAASFGGTLLLYSGRRWAAAVVFAVAGAIRSNGVIYVLLILHHAILSVPPSSRSLKSLANAATRAIPQFVLVAVPLVAFQAYAYAVYCVTRPSNPSASDAALWPRPWCSASIPSSYSFVQSHYWNNGFLRYYTWKQAPNFAIALPTIVLSATGIATYARRFPTLFLSAGLFGGGQGRDQGGFYTPHALSLVYIWMVLAVVATTTMHVQDFQLCRVAMFVMARYYWVARATWRS